MLPLLAAAIFAVSGAAAAAAQPLRCQPPDAALDEPAAARFAALALKCLHEEYPNHLSHTLSSDADAKPPHELTPAFYGCYDWHSDVHGHWLLVRLIRLFPEADFVPAARAAIAQSLTPEHIAGEVALSAARGSGLLRAPYGLAWLLALAAELRGWNDRPGARMGIDARAAGDRGRHAARELGGKAALPDPGGRARSNRLLIQPGLGLGRRSRSDAQMHSVLAYAARRFYLPGPELSAGLRAVGRGFPLALPRARRTSCAASLGTRGLRALAVGLPAAAFRRTRASPGCCRRW